MIEAGQPAPDFTLPDQDGEPVTLVRPARPPRSSSTSTPRPTRRAARRRPAGSATTAPTTRPPARACSASRPTRSSGQDVPRRAGPELHAAGRRGPRGRRGLRDLGREVDVRPDLLGTPRATFIIDPDGVVRPRHPEGLAEDARRGGARALDEAGCRGVAARGAPQRAVEVRERRGQAPEGLPTTRVTSRRPSPAGPAPDDRGEDVAAQVRTATSIATRTRSSGSPGLRASSAASAGASAAAKSSPSVSLRARSAGERSWVSRKRRKPSARAGRPCRPSPRQRTGRGCRRAARGAPPGRWSRAPARRSRSRSEASHLAGAVEEQLLLAAEVVEDRLDRHVGRLGDLGERHRLEAALHEQPRGDVRDGLAQRRFLRSRRPSTAEPAAGLRRAGGGDRVKGGTRTSVPSRELYIH